MIAALMSRVSGWMVRPAPPARLAVLRVLVATFTTVYLLVRLPVFAGLADEAAGRWEPVGVLWWMDRPPSGAAVGVLLTVALISGVLLAAGAARRISGPLCATTVLVLTTMRSSMGQLLWFENLMVIHLMIVGVTASTDACTWPRRSVRREAHERYGWPVQLAATATVITYVLAGVAKLRGAGLAWVDGESLRNHVAHAAARLRLLGGEPSPLARVLVDVEWLFAPLAMAALVLELGAPVALIGSRWRAAWVAGVWTMHVAIAATMFVVFAYPIALVAFAPLFPLERLRLRRLRPAGGC